MRGLEFVPSENFDEDVKLLEEFLELLEVDFILIPDNPLNQPYASSVLCAKMLSDRLGQRTIATISGGGKSKESAKSLLLGSKYARISGIACVSGDSEGLKAVEVLELAKELDFDYKICTLSDIETKARLGATHAITQPLFSPFFSLPPLPLPILPSFMPIFSPQTLPQIVKNQKLLGFGIPQSYAKDLIKSNVKILTQLKDFYLIPLNLKKQMPYFRELFHHCKIAKFPNSSPQECLDYSSETQE